MPHHLEPDLAHHVPRQRPQVPRAQDQQRRAVGRLLQGGQRVVGDQGLVDRQVRVTVPDGLRASPMIRCGQ
ncbi:hypothetical protein O1L55_13430 [Streptomyces albulus]|nr:hypothetical protein [Streptomyces noursei]